MTFLYDEVTDFSGSYDLSVSILDKLYQQDRVASKVKLRPFKCANIFDRATLKSLVYIDIDSAKGQHDVVFNYGFSDCNEQYKLN
jgi:hypothetical protein